MDMLNRISNGFRSTGKNADAGKEEASRAAQRLQHTVQASIQKGGTFVAEHPVLCLSAALAAGVAVGWWVKRK